MLKRQILLLTLNSNQFIPVNLVFHSTSNILVHWCFLSLYL